MTLVVDASVIIKWLVQAPDREQDTARATRVMEHILADGNPMLQPVHWLAEVGGALARLTPVTAEADVLMLRAMELPVDDSPSVYRRACQLAIDLEQHLFDTLYHAVALEQPSAVLVTADERYLRVGGRQGHIVGLSDWVAT